jgi:hypothetical protein
VLTGTVGLAVMQRSDGEPAVVTVVAKPGRTLDRVRGPVDGGDLYCAARSRAPAAARSHRAWPGAEVEVSTMIVVGIFQALAGLVATFDDGFYVV